jgi:hypothetical protein
MREKLIWDWFKSKQGKRDVSSLKMLDKLGYVNFTGRADVTFAS